MSPAQLTPAERQALVDALYVGNMRLSDLEFARNPFQVARTLPLVQRSIDRPLDAADELMRLHAATKGAPLPVIARNAARTGLSDPAVADAVVSIPVDVSQAPQPMREPLARLIGWIHKSKADVQAVLNELQPEDRRALVEALPRWAAEEQEVSFDFIQGRGAARPQIIPLVDKLDLAYLRRSAVGLAAEVQRVATELAAVPDDLPETLKFTVEGVRVVLAGRGRHVHDVDAVDLLIDLGGNDLYRGRPGGAVQGVSVLIDLAGDDLYTPRDVALGGALLGIGIAHDLAGDDVYRAGNLALGAGLAGVGLFCDQRGDDVYDARALAQGFGQFGVGVSLDSEGHDSYRGELFVQGAARTQGVGWLVDQAGSDTYWAGGLVLNSPLFATAHYSFAQGFASGYREDTGGTAGGVGLLTDHAGNDHYLGETYMQAASYWHALGSLFDSSGNDSYTGTQYAQSSAMHLCAAYLFDLAGDDGYLMRFGAAHAIGHDYGVAMLLDRAGDDVVAGRDTSPGLGVANGLGLFVDAGGIDRYPGAPGQGQAARDTGSLGVFADLGGQDRYMLGLADAQAWWNPTWGVALDREDAPAVGPGAAAPRTPPVPGSERKPSDQELASIYAKATQWGVGTAQEEVAKNTDRLIAIGVPAWEWMLANRLRNADRLQIRAFVAVAQALKEAAGPAFGRLVLNSKDVPTLRNALSVAAEGGITDMRGLIPALLRNPELQAAAVRAAGRLKASEASSALMELCGSTDRMLVRNAISSLRLIGDVAALGTAQALLNSDDLPTRMAALELIASFPDQGLIIGETLTRDPDEVKARNGARVLARIGTPGALDSLGQLLLDPRAGVRIEALLGLHERCPSDFAQTMLELREDPIPLVRAVASRVRPL